MNPPVPWSELHRALTDHAPEDRRADGRPLPPVEIVDMRDRPAGAPLHPRLVVVDSPRTRTLIVHWKRD